MKKFASITIAMLMVVSMMLSSIVSTSALTGLDKGAKGTITLTKYESNSNKSKPVEGATFVAYQVMSLTVDGDQDGTFTVADAFTNIVTAADLVHTGKNANDKVFKSTKELEAKIPAMEAVAANAAYKQTFAETETKNDGIYTATDLPLGVYLVVETAAPSGYIKDTKSFLVSVPEWTGSAWDYSIAAQPKNVPVTLTKMISDPDQNGALVNEAVYAIGDTVDYSVSALIPNYDDETIADMKANNKNYDKLFLKFTDTVDAGLTFVDPSANTVTAKCGNKTFTFGTDYTAVVSGQTLTIDFNNWAVLEAYEGQIITLTYQAVLNENAEVEDTNENTVKFRFVDKLDDFAAAIDPSTEVDPENPDEDFVGELEDDAQVFTYQMNLNKTFEGNAPTADIDATAVTFKLYKEDGTAIKVIKNDNGDYTVYDGTGKTTQDTVNLTADGKLELKGLEEGTYYLEETATASGYAIPTTRIKFALAENDITKEDANYTHIGVNPTHHGASGEAEPLRLVSGKTNTFEVDVNNVKKQFTLPTTGGDGLLIFTIAGGILMAAAIILFTTLRKKSTSK